MKILILGGTSLTGPFTTPYLVEQGHQVTIFHRGRHQVDLPTAVNRIIGERHKLDEFSTEFRQQAPDVVLDLLAFTCQDAEILMRVFKGIAKQVVVPSSIDVYRAFGRLHGTEPGPVEPIPLAEDAPLRENLSIHKEEYEKRWVEQAVMADPDLPGTILRYPMIYGWWIQPASVQSWAIWKSCPRRERCAGPLNGNGQIPWRNLIQRNLITQPKTRFWPN